MTVVVSGLLPSAHQLPSVRSPVKRDAHPLVVTLLSLPLPDGNVSGTPAGPPHALKMTRPAASRDVHPAPDIEWTEERMRPLESEQSRSVMARGASEPATATDLAEFTDYRDRLYREIARYAVYPEMARHLHPGGVTSVSFRLDRLGNLLQSRIARGSGSVLLDDAALGAVRRAQPLPPIPPALPAPMDFEVEIDSAMVPSSVAVEHEPGRMPSRARS